MVNISRQVNKDNFIEITGKVSPQKSLTIYLQPGERIVRVMVKEGSVIKEGASMIQLTNDALLSQIAMFKEKELAIEKEQNRGEVIKTKIIITNDIIRRLEKQIKEERQISAEIPGYMIESKERALIQEKINGENDIKLLRKELLLLNEGRQNRDDFYDFLARKIKDVQGQIDDLLIKAPFNGRVIRISQALNRVKLGDLILEFWDDENLKVTALAYQNQLQHIRPGYKAKIFSTFNEDSFIWGTVVSIGSPAESDEKDQFPTFPVVINIDNKNTELIVGMSLTVGIMKTDNKGPLRNE